MGEASSTGNGGRQESGSAATAKASAQVTGSAGGTNASVEVIGSAELKRLVDLALAHSPDFQTSQRQLQITQLQTKNARAVFLPSLDVNATYGPQGFNPNPAGLPGWQSDAQLTLTESFYDNGQSYHNYQIAKLNEQQAQLNYHLAKGKIILAVVKAFYDWSFAVQQMLFTQKSSQEVDRQFKLTASMYHDGVKTQADYLRFKSQSERSHLDIISTERQRQVSYHSLLEILGLKEEEPESAILPAAAPPTYSSFPNFDISSDGLQEAQILRIQEKISEQQVALTADLRRPQAFLTGALGYGSQNYAGSANLPSNPQTSWDVLLNLKWNLWDFGIRERNEQITRAGQDITQNTLRSQWLLAAQNLADFRFDWIHALQIKQMTDELEKAEELNFQKVQLAYREGRLTYLDLSSALSNLLDSQSRKTRSDFDVAYDVVLGRYFKGELDEDHLE